jgi:N-acetylmuramoyl-L-alanine amidase
MTLLNIIPAPSPSHDSRGDQHIDMLVLHYTGMESGEAALKRLRDPESKVSSHYLIEEDGQVFALVDENQRAWHSGVSYWRGHTNINQRSIGIEIVNPGHEFGYRRFTDAQIEVLIPLCKEILGRHPIPAQNVVGHSDVAPQRKEDPGELFPWRLLAEHDIGLYPTELPLDGVGAENLAPYGYDLSKPRFAITAFQRHFRPTLLDGEWDDECAHLLAALLKMV